MIKRDDLNTTIITLIKIQKAIQDGKFDGWGFNDDQLNTAIHILLSIENILYKESK